MGVTIEVKDGSVAEVTGPAKIVVTTDIPGSVLIDGEPVVKPPEPFVPLDPPLVTGLSPNTAPAGDPADITMSVMGENFTPDCVIVFNGYDEPTTFVSAAQVSTGVKPSLFVVPADCPVAVRDGAGQMSNEIVFSFTDPAVRSSRSRR